MRVLAAVAGLLLTAASEGRAQSPLERPFLERHDFDLTPRVRDAVVEECDSDLDGALLGAAIGATPIVIGLITSRNGTEEGLGWLVLGLAGGIAGFWAGLAYDSMDCDEDPGRGDPRRPTTASRDSRTLTAVRVYAFP